MSDTFVLINTPYKILWHDGAIIHCLPFRPCDVRSTVNGVEYWICEYSEKHIEATPTDYPRHDILRCFFDTDTYKELVQNAQIHNGTNWVSLDLSVVASHSLQDTYTPIERVLNHHLRSYEILRQSYILDKQSLPALESLQKEIEHLRSKIESGFSGEEYCMYKTKTVSK